MGKSNPQYPNPSNPSAAAAQYAGYTQFYGQAPQTMAAPRGAPLARPPPRPMAPPPGVAMRSSWGAPRGPPPRPGPATTQQNQWQWSQGGPATTVVAAAPPVMYNAMRGPPRPVAPSYSPAAPGPAVGATPNVNSTKWPDSLHDYVKRAFARCKGAADQSLTQNALKELITNAIMTSTLWTKNWLAEPLPTLVGDTVAAKPNVVNHMAPPARGMMPQSMGFRPPPGPARGVPGAFIPFDGPNLMKDKKRKADAFASKQLEDMNKKNQRRDRFLKEQMELGGTITPSVDPRTLKVLNNDGELDLEAMTIKGTCQVIEKEYLRLTSPPHPSTVRPEPVLKKALEMVKTKWKKSECDYIYACSQLKSIRQDCTVQRIKNEFTVLVYETHARVALESGDINEFNQCQTQLHELYEKSIPGQAIEFMSYRILYCIYVSLQAKKPDSNAGQLGMYSVLTSVTPELRREESVRHALDVREAVSTNDYHRFFKLYAKAPKMAGYLMDPMVGTIRLRALRAICKAYRPNVPIDFVRQELNLEGKDGEAFIKQSGMVFVSDSNGELVDTKNSDIVWVLSDQSSLI